MITLKSLLLCAAFAGLALPALQAQTVNPTDKKEELGEVWECVLPGGDYIVALRSIVGVASHTYLVQGGIRVYEVNIMDQSSCEARFYYMETPLDGSAVSPAVSALSKLEDIAAKITERTKTDKVWEKVIKDYPTSTHAHTIEYRLDSKKNLEALFQHLRKAWLSKVGGRFTVQGA